MEDKKDTVRDTQNDDSKEIITKDVELTNLQESHNVNNDISYSNDEGVQNEVQSPVGTVGTYEKDDIEKPPFSAKEESSLEPHIDGDINDIHVDLPIQLPCVEPSETYSETQAEGETKSKSNEMELDREVGTIEEELNSERNGETLTQAEGETKSKSNEMELDREVGTIEEELNSERNGEMLNSEVRDVGTIEEELNSERNGETLNSEVREVGTIEEESNSERNGEISKSDVLEVGTIEEESTSERNGETLNSEVKLTLEGETKEDKTISGSNGMEFHQDTKSNDKDSENLVAESVVLLGNGVKEELSRTATMKEEIHENEIKKELLVDELDEGDATEFNSVNSSFLLSPDATEEEETGTPEEQLAFAKELENFHKERFLDFRPPRFYQEPLNLLKLWRATVRLGGYEQVTSCKLWRQIGESFKPPKTCTTVSWTFRSFYEKALLEYEKHKLRCGELPYTESSFSDHIGVATPLITVGSGRQRRDAASRAMQGWHSRLVGNGEVGDPTIKDKISISSPKREKPLKSIGLLKRKMPSPVEHAVKVVRMTASDPQSEADVIDIGHPADWVKINVQRTKDCFEVYALIPGLLREEVRVQSDAVGRLVITGQPDQMDNPWGVTPFRKVVSLPSRIDPHQTSAVVTLQGQLFVRVPFDPLDI